MCEFIVLIVNCVRFEACSSYLYQSFVAFVVFTHLHKIIMGNIKIFKKFHKHCGTNVLLPDVNFRLSGIVLTQLKVCKSVS